MTKNPAAVALGKLGGAVKSQKKTEAARANIKKRWYMSKSLKAELPNSSQAATSAEIQKPSKEHIPANIKNTKGYKNPLKPGETDLLTF